LTKSERKYVTVTLSLLFLPSALLTAGAQRRDSLLTKTHQLQNVEVVGSSLRRVNNSALNAIAVDVNKLKNTTLDLAGILNKVSGVKIRQDGGLGSSTSINLNGFTGKHVKIFLDGVPMDGSASSFSLSNMPASLASAIEVYKGVVPVEFGADALGGAVNIVSNKLRGTYVDASYSYGSFNTHRSSITFSHVSQGGLLLTLNAYQNYSDNDYKVKVQNVDLQTMAYSSDEEWHRRFHDRYHNEAVVAQIGLVNKSWADKIALGFTYSHEYAQIQNANLMKIVFGKKYRTAEGITPSLTYMKRNFITPRLDVTLSAKYDVVTTNNVDTAARNYNWAGEYVAKQTQGEGIATIAEYRGKTATVVTNVKYRWWRKNFLTVNNTFSDYVRNTTDNAANAVMQSASTYMRRKNVKNVLGAEYKFVPNEHWNVMAMAKYYYTHVWGPVNVSTTVGRDTYEEQERTSKALGFGLAGTWHLNDDWQFKASFERTARLPNVRELFGDGDYEQGEADLKPETSYNFNFNVLYEHTFNREHLVSVELGFNNRNIRDYIIRTISSRGTAISTNHGKVLGYGTDATLRYAFRNRLAINGSYALQSMRNREKLTANGAESQTYNDRVPNLPYSFGNADATYYFHHVLGEDNTLSITYGLQYVHRFYRSWRSEGAQLYIPEQLSHDASLVYAIRGGRYNIALEANNFTNEALYDNYSLQKPGRNFAIKFRYVFYKR
jgi:outer membrane receptor protein involved in Fe transport